jgi:hypothetical protein
MRLQNNASNDGLILTFPDYGRYPDMCIYLDAKCPETRDVSMNYFVEYLETRSLGPE